MAKGWYVVHTYSGYENKIEKHIRKFMEQPEFSAIVLDIKVPSEDVIEMKDGKKKIISRKTLPGYILLEMDLPDIGWKKPCSQIRMIDGVTGFLGQVPGSKPRPIPSEEMRAILQKSGDMKADKVSALQQEFSVGESVKIVDGPFDSFTGKIDEVNGEKAKLKVTVGIFGRATPVEVDFSQVEKI